MTSTAQDSGPASDVEARYGIKRVTTEHFEYGGYRYTNLADAIAQARRSEPGQGVS